MDMRCLRENVQMERRVGCGVSQATVEGEITLPGGLREEARVLHAGGMAVIESSECIMDRAGITGRVVFHALYTQGDPGRVCAMEATADFTHVMELPGTQPKMLCRAEAEVEHVEASASGGRMTLRAVLRICARVSSQQPVSALTGIADAPGLQVRTQQLTVKRTVASGSGETLLREEFPLPAGLQVRETLCGRAIIRTGEITGGMGRAGVGGTVQLEIYHASDMPGKPLVVTRHTVPFLHAVELTGEDGALLDGSACVKDVAVASQESADGERTLRAEVLLGVHAWADRTDSLTLLQDGYTTCGDALSLTRQEVCFRVDDTRVQTAESGKCMLMLPEGSPAARTVLCAFASPCVTGREQVGGRLTVEGVLEITLLYMTDDSPAPVSLFQEEPFRITFAAEIGEEDPVTLAVCDAEATAITSDRVELKYVMHLAARGVRTCTAALVTDAEPVAAPDPARGMILCFPQGGETLWDVARRYRVPVEQLKSMNPGAEDVASRRGIVVWKKEG